MSKKITTEEFIEKARKVYGDLYDYDETVYSNSLIKVKITCKTHGVFETNPSNYLKGHGCAKCAGVGKSNTEDFINKATKIHGNIYDYSEVVYVNSNTKIKIICKNHGEFFQTPDTHTKKINPSGCPKCAGKGQLNTEEFIEKARKIYGNRYDYGEVVLVSSKTKVKIICKIHGVFETNPHNYLKGHGCAKCAGNCQSNTEEFIKRAIEIHGNRYDYSEAVYINAKEKVKIICKEHGRFEQLPKSHLHKAGCSKCAGVGQLNTEEFITKAIKIHGDRYDYSEVVYVKAKEKVKIICKTHGVFVQNPAEHLIGRGCSKCAGNCQSNTEEFIKQAIEIHGNRYDYSKVVYVKATRKVKIICKEHGEFETNPSNYLKGHGCAKCAGVGKSNTEEFIVKAIKIHGDKYDYSKVVYINCHTKIKIICKEHGEFEQEVSSHLSGAGCPICNLGFTTTYNLRLLQDLSSSDLLTMDPIELAIIIGQGKLPTVFKPLINTESNSEERLTTLKELKEYLQTEDEFEDDEFEDDRLETVDCDFEEVELEDKELDSVPITEEPRLPQINPMGDLHSLDNSLYAGIDKEALDTLVEYKLRKLWNSTLNKEVSIESLKGETGGRYFTCIKELFLEEYGNVIQLEPKENYSFPYPPNLMQKLTVYRLMKNKYYGNWSGTGSGKTLSFILAAREIDSKLTVVIAVNSTINQTEKVIKSVYPNSKVFNSYQDGFVFDRNENNFLILNYEKFQQEYSEEMFQSLTNNNQIDFVVIDEVHNTKQRTEDDESIRRGTLNRFLGRIRESNSDLHVLAMSATPVINSLFEAKSLLSLMSGLEYNDLQTRRTVGNALIMFQQLTLNGLRFKPKYDINIQELTGSNMSNLSIDGSHHLNTILDIPKGSTSFIDIEKLILDDKLNAITSYLRSGTIIYSYFTSEFISTIKRYVESLPLPLKFKVGTYTGDDSPEFRSQNLEDFKSGKIDILIGSRPIGTGVDGLQEVCDRMIIVSLPWTNAEYEQLKGRIYRQGSIFNNVEVIIPQVRISLEEGSVWSWDIQRLNLIKNKKTLADAAVDGVIPSASLPRQETMFQKSQDALRSWKERIGLGNVIEINRSPIQIDLYPEIDNLIERSARINSELDEFNRLGKVMLSANMHKRFVEDQDSWFRYHALRKARMEKWEEIPYEYIATKIGKRSIVADFGCGENLLKVCIPNNKVYAFDHVAIDDTVMACDMRETGLDSESIDVAVFSLALWGPNYREYLEEAHRILDKNGFLYIAEPSSKYGEEDRKKLIELLGEIGFKILGNIENRGKFIYVTGVKL